MSRDDEALTINKNFKASAIIDQYISDLATELGASSSAVIRASVLFAGPVLANNPALIDLNRRELAELAANIGKIKVTRHISFEPVKDEGAES